MAKLRVAVIGVGHLGRHHARILSRLDGVELVGVADTSAARCAEVAAQCGVPAYEDYRVLIPAVDAASIVVPTSGHFEVASALLGAGKSALVEKPLAAVPAQADELVELARRRGALLQVGHIERFNPVLESLPDVEELPQLIAAHRLGPYTFRSTDISVVFDLMIHDLDIVLTLVGELPERVAAIGWSVFGGKDDVAASQLTFPGGTVAHLFASRADFSPRREMTVRWRDAFAHLDFANQRSTTATARRALRENLDRFANPHIQEIPALRAALEADYFEVRQHDFSAREELLAVELKHFVHCLQTHAEPRVSGRQARDAVQIAAVIEEAARQHPYPVLLPSTHRTPLAA